MRFSKEQLPESCEAEPFPELQTKTYVGSQQTSLSIQGASRRSCKSHTRSSAKPESKANLDSA